MNTAGIPQTADALLKFSHTYKSDFYLQFQIVLFAAPHSGAVSIPTCAVYICLVFYIRWISRSSISITTVPAISCTVHYMNTTKQNTAH
jgi:hypothetical protein